MDIKLNFINRSNDANNSEIVIFQKNQATNYDELHVAWRVIKNCGVYDNHPFTFPMAMEVSAADSFGNHTPRLPATNGDLFHMAKDGSGDVLSRVGPANSSKEVHVRNDLAAGAINAGIFKDGKLLALKTSVAPGQKAVFEIKPTIWIGVASQIEEGKVMASAVISDINTELSLLNVASADIVLTGGGPGPNSQPFTFTLENVRTA
ncbi:hypothetical protein [Massilia sp. YIM B04103]|uniref:hypothetical protein n=1 Tax=Massilia sp. YIM B04103 TaxID=2963106 RepID=UPI00210A573F|nr:hypothetical protein [Massilia sp. YIM B04103]